MGVKFDGLDKLQKELKKMERNAKKLNGTHQIPLNELFTSSFMRKHTKFSSIDAFFKASGFKADTQEDFEAIPDSELDKFVAKNTKFRTWEDMLGEAGSEYALKKLGF